MGKADEFHLKVFNAYHVDRNQLKSDAEVMDFIAKAGIDKQKFSDIYGSFGVTNKLSRSTQLMNLYQIDSWPKIIIDGRYVTAPAMAAVGMGRVTEMQQNQAQIPVLDFIIDKIKKEKR